jgi:phosphatidylinositol-3-phosphatase
MKLRSVFLGPLFTILLFSAIARAQWVAFNDHYVGPGTHPNATLWNVWDTAYGAPGFSGPLKNIATGAVLPVILTFTNFNAGPNNLSLGPNAGSAAYNIFNGYVDFTSTTPYVMVRLEATLGASMGEVLSSLDPSKRYSVKLTAVRGGGSTYLNRWTLMELVGASAYTNGHTAGSYTNGLQPNQVAINTGENRVDGATAVWGDIDPGPDGIIAIVSRQYTGPLPGGGSGSTAVYGYGPIALRVEEFVGGPSPARIAAQPAALQNIFEDQPLQLSVVAVGSAPLSVQWFKDQSPIMNATNSTLTISNAALTDSGTYFARATNDYGNAMSSNAIVNIVGKQTPFLSLIQFTNQWRFNQSGIDLGSAWRANDYSDSGWNMGRGLLAYANYAITYPEPKNTDLSPVDNSGNSITTYYLRTDFNFPVASTNVLLLITNLLDDGAIFYLNNQELMHIRLPNGNVGYATFAENSPTSGTLYEPTNALGTALVSGRNILAVELHQYIPFSSDATFAMNVRAYAFPSEPLALLSDPASRIVNEEETVIFNADVFGGGNVRYQWFRNGFPIGNGTNQTLVIPEVHGSHEGSYSFTASNSVNGVASGEAQLTVIPDTAAPRMLAAYLTNAANTVVIQFSEPLDPTSATNIAAYSFSPSLAVTEVTIESPSAVRVMIAGYDPQFTYSFTVTGVRDKATIPNQIAAGSTTRIVVTPIFGNLMSAVQTVFVIVMENHDWDTILGNPTCPYINNVLLPMASYANQFYTPNDLHPSEPNYIWMEAGTNFGIFNDLDPSQNRIFSTNHLTTLLRNAGISWKTYQENIPGNTCPITSQYPYGAWHNPFVFFEDVTSDFSYCTNHNRPFTELATDLANNRVAAYNFITPNLTNDMHDYSPGSPSSEGQGDYWLSLQMPMILNSAAYTNNGAVFITWDEGSPAGPIGMIVLSPLAKGGGYNNNIHYTHSSLLRSMQEIFGVRPFLADAANASSLSDLFKTISLSGAWMNNQFVIQLQNLQASKTYYLQASADLRTWTSISTNSGAVSIAIPDANAGSYSQRFYRVIQKP